MPGMSDGGLSAPHFPVVSSFVHKTGTAHKAVPVFLAYQADEDCRLAVAAGLRQYGRVGAGRFALERFAESWSMASVQDNNEETCHVHYPPCFR